MSGEEYIESYLTPKDIEHTLVASPVESGAWEDSCLKKFPVPKIAKVDITPEHLARFFAILEAKVGVSSGLTTNNLDAPDLHHIQDMIISFGTQLAVTADRKKHIFLDFPQYNSDFLESPDTEFVSPNVLLFESRKSEAKADPPAHAEKDGQGASGSSDEAVNAKKARDELNAQVLALNSQYTVFKNSLSFGNKTDNYATHLEEIAKLTPEEFDKYKATVGAWCISHIKCIVKGDLSMTHYYNNKFQGHISGTYQFNPKTLLKLSPVYYQFMGQSLRRNVTDTHSALIRLSAALREMVGKNDQKLTCDALRSLVTMVMFEHSLAAVSWVQKAANALRIGFVELCEQLRIKGMTDETLKRVIDFHIQYRLDPTVYNSLSTQLKSRISHVDSFYYKIARVLDQSYFRLIGSNNNDYVVGACIQIVMSRNEDSNLGDYKGYRDQAMFNLGKEIGNRYLLNFSEKFTSDKIITTPALRGLDLSKVLRPKTMSNIGPQLNRENVPVPVVMVKDADSALRIM